ncbi:hypothetical protein LIER_32671 [Lithospermum erythrorhizon]|uniref:NPH3 domain-containing protein n=1 Tax=Lithospermum erythrorhizon TaxID=34254 RepID=A0AAV3RUH1_LITER
MQRIPEHFMEMDQITVGAFGSQVDDRICKAQCAPPQAIQTTNSRNQLAESKREQMCRIIDCQKLSLDACTHAAQNERRRNFKNYSPDEKRHAWSKGGKPSSQNWYGQHEEGSVTNQNNENEKAKVKSGKHKKQPSLED